MNGLKQSIDADSPQLITNLPQIKMLITHFISIPGNYCSPSNQQNQGTYQHIFNDPSPAQYAIIQDKPKALEALINLSCHPSSKYKTSVYYGLPIDNIFTPKEFSTNCKLPLLNLAVRVNNFRCLKILVEYLKENKHTIDTTDRDNHTPLLEAVLNSNSELTLYLLREGADPLFTPTNNVKSSISNCSSSPSLARPIMSALFATPELFLYMVQTLKDMKQSEKYEVLFTEKYNPTSFQVVSQGNGGKSLQEVLSSRQDLALSRKVFQHILENKEINVASAISGAKNTINPQHITIPVELCTECHKNPSCCVCPECGKHLCPLHEAKHDCK